MTYTDKRGYKREPSNLVHRHRAYHHIYLKDRKKYPLSFESYEIHHIDGNKNNNRMDNLAVLTPEEHDKAHEIMERDKVIDKIMITKIKAKKIFIRECFYFGIPLLILLGDIYFSIKNPNLWVPAIIMFVGGFIFIVFFLSRLGKIIRSIRILLKKPNKIKESDYQYVMFGY